MTSQPGVHQNAGVKKCSYLMQLKLFRSKYCQGINIYFVDKFLVSVL